jgi:survival motor neuron protein
LFEFIDLFVYRISHNDDVQMIENSSLSSSENTKWKLGDLCLCPYTEDGLLYKATISDLSSSSSCTVTFDDYGNEEIHPLTDLQIRIEEQQQESILSVDETDELPQPPPPPSLPPFPVLNSNDDKDSLSATLMSWYLAGYHTGFYQGIKDKK